MASDLWTYPEHVRRGVAGIGPALEELDLTEFSVAATDGEVGSVDSASHEPGASFIVVDTGPLVFGKKVVVPAGRVRSVDGVGQTVEIDLAKDQLNNAPEADEERIRDESYRAELSRYYTEASR